MRNPFATSLDLQRQTWENAAQFVESLDTGPDAAEEMLTVDVGQTPSEVVYEENKLQLLHYESRTDQQHDVPILIVYALINRPYILDLQPDRSVVRTLLDNGFDVYLIDWGEPSTLDASLTLHDYVDRYIDNCVDVVRERSGQESINLLGYCMGGTMSTMYAALHPEKVRTLGLMAAGLCFTGTGGVLELWGAEDYYRPSEVTETFGNVPAAFLDVGFAMMDPVQNYLTKYVNLYENLDDDDRVRNFARMEKWLNDGIDIAGATYEQFLQDIYQENKLMENELYLDGKHVDINNIDMPVLQIVAEYDHLVPPAASKPFNDVIPSDDTEIIEFRTGHIGMSVSSRSHEELWPQVCEWFAERMPEDESVPIEVEGTDAADEDAVDLEEAEPAEEPGLETVDGIGPTYGERLREAGVETLSDLAAADAEDLAETAGMSPSRVRDWIDQAGELTA